jgi:methylthioribose-1-phosphate isomerase
MENQNYDDSSERKKQLEDKLQNYIDKQEKTTTQQLLECDLNDNRSIGHYGAEAVSQQNTGQTKLTVLTHCNTGSSATVGFGTALECYSTIGSN